jgi:hypothetical protein
MRERFKWLRTYGPLAGYFEHGNKISVFVEGGEFHYHISDYQLVNKELASNCTCLFLVF